MFRTIILIFLLTATPVFAQVPENPTQDVIAMCASLGEFAEIMFNVRNRGLPLSTALNTVYESNPDSDPSIVQMLVSVVRSVYSEPQYQTEEIQIQQIQQFRNRLETECFNQNLK
jgi:hypothetical protein